AVMYWLLFDCTVSGALASSWINACNFGIANDRPRGCPPATSSDVDALSPPSGVVCCEAGVDAAPELLVTGAAVDEVGVGDTDSDGVGDSVTTLSGVVADVVGLGDDPVDSSGFAGGVVTSSVSIMAGGVSAVSSGASGK